MGVLNVIRRLMAAAAEIKDDSKDATERDSKSDLTASDATGSGDDYGDVKSVSSDGSSNLA